MYVPISHVEALESTAEFKLAITASSIHLIWTSVRENQSKVVGKSAGRMHHKPCDQCTQQKSENGTNGREREQISLGGREFRIIKRIGRNVITDDLPLLIGFDRIKDPATLIAAYDDSAGVTAQFSLNLLHRINRELDGNIAVDKFRHVAVWSDIYARIEIYLEAQSDVTLPIGGKEYHLAAGQKIHIENSHKYGLRDARLMLRAGGWTPVQEWSDENDYFTLMLVEAHAYKHAP